MTHFFIKISQWYQKYPEFYADSKFIEMSSTNVRKKLMSKKQRRKGQNWKNSKFAYFFAYNYFPKHFCAYFNGIAISRQFCAF